jgi:hypothetical protein
VGKPIGHSATRAAIGLTIIGLCVFGVGCRQGPKTIWKAEVRSPDDLWLARVETVQTGGFGSAAIMTTVYLKRTNVSGPATQVLGFWCEGPAPRGYVLDNIANKGGTINLTMKWLSPSRLEVSYDGRADLNFQVVKIGGVDISVRNLATETTNTSQ